MEGTKYRATTAPVMEAEEEEEEHLLHMLSQACKISGVTAPPMQPLSTRPKPRWELAMSSSRKESQLMGQFLKDGASMILSCKGKRELLAIRFMLSREKSKGLSGRVSGGLKKGVVELLMATGSSCSSNHHHAAVSSPCTAALSK
ncbi:hypothetical protein OIU79_012246 [Salix purpurea]|uniref:Uncharacterized protein n=1 Tax=Salix purpurea TaxID=77065 RepID=A0A9Q0Q365_SALPP|nr:hypothetical protein OIU79_012246 [Salix purpurea]